MTLLLLLKSHVARVRPRCLTRLRVLLTSHKGQQDRTCSYPGFLVPGL